MEQANPAPIKADASATQIITQSVPAAPMQQTDAPFANFDLDSLIPKELRDAVDKAEEPKEVTPGGNTGQVAPAPTDPSELSEVDKLVSQIIPDETTQTDDTDTPPFWAENENYKELLTHLNYSGVPTALLSKFAQEIADKSTIDNGKLVNGFETENQTLKAQIEDFKNEVIRLREVEREAVFDTLPETMDNFTTPMGRAAETIKTILDLEGSQTPVGSILNCPNKVELDRTLRELDLDTDQLASLKANWRTYKETERDFQDAKKQARASLVGKLDIRIPRERATDIMRKVLIDATSSEDKYKYIRTGIDEGLDKHEHVSKVLGLAQDNFQQIAEALSDPHSVVRNPKELQKIAKFMLNSAHNSYLASMYGQLKESSDKQTQDMLQIAKAYVDLKKSAGGSTKPSGGPLIPGAMPASKAGGASTADDDAKLFKDFLSGKAKLDDLLA